MKKKQTREETINRMLPGLIVFLLAIVMISSIFHLRSSCPAVQAKRETVEIAKRYVGLEEADHFYWFIREKTYFSLMGTNDEEKGIAVIIPKSGEKVKVLDQTRRLTENEVKQTIAITHPEIQIEKTALGTHDDQPVWEVIGKEADGKLNYYLIGFELGGEVKTIKGI